MVSCLARCFMEFVITIRRSCGVFVAGTATFERLELSMFDFHRDLPKSFRDVSINQMVIIWMSMLDSQSLHMFLQQRKTEPLS